jgi:RND family efflux transporter MFP subunit
VSDDEKAQTLHETAVATAEAAARQLELARNRLKYTVLRASRSGVVTAVRFEAGQVVAEGQPIVTLANEGEPEIVVDVPEDHLNAFKGARYRAWLHSAPDQTFDVVLRELSPQAAATTRTFRARLKPAAPRALPLGATATLVIERPVGDAAAAVIPASAITQDKGRPAVWVVRRAGVDAHGTVDLVGVSVHGYRNEEVLVSGPAAGELVVTAGVQKMAPGLKVALSPTAHGADTKQASR